MKRKSWKLIPEAGTIDNLKLVEEELDSPAPNEAQVAVKSIGLNFADIFAMFGLYGATPKGAFVPGLEFAGEVIRVGANVTKLKVGDRVMGITRFGGYTSHINQKEDYLVAIPSEWSYAQGAAYLVQVLTAWYALVELANIQPNATVLIQSAAGGVGLWANRLCKHFKATTIGVVGTHAKFGVLDAEGFDHKMVRSNNFSTELQKLLDGRDLNIVLDSVGGTYFTDCYKLMAAEGRMVVYGSARYAQTGVKPNKLKMLIKFLQRPKLDPQKLIEHNKSVMGFNLIWLYENIDKLKSILAQLSTIDLGIPVVGHEYDMENMKDAIAFFQTGKNIGKIVVNVK